MGLPLGFGFFNFEVLCSVILSPSLEDQFHGVSFSSHLLLRRKYFEVGLISWVCKWEYSLLGVYMVERLPGKCPFYLIGGVKWAADMALLLLLLRGPLPWLAWHAFLLGDVQQQRTLAMFASNNLLPDSSLFATAWAVNYKCTRLITVKPGFINYLTLHCQCKKCLSVCHSSFPYLKTAYAVVCVSLCPCGIQLVSSGFSRQFKSIVVGLVSETRMNSGFGRPYRILKKLPRNQTMVFE